MSREHGLHASQLISKVFFVVKLIFTECFGNIATNCEPVTISDISLCSIAAGNVIAGRGGEEEEEEVEREREREEMAESR